MSMAKKYILGSIIVFVINALAFYLIANLLYEIILRSEVKEFIRMFSMRTPSFFLLSLSFGFLYALLFITIGILELFFKVIKKIIPPEIDNNYVWMISAILIAYLIYTIIFSFNLWGGARDAETFGLERIQYMIYAGFFGLVLNSLIENLDKLFPRIFLYTFLSAILVSGFSLLITGWDHYSVFSFVEYLLLGFVVLASLSLTVKYFQPIEFKEREGTNPEA